MRERNTVKEKQEEATSSLNDKFNKYTKAAVYYCAAAFFYFSRLLKNPRIVIASDQRERGNPCFCLKYRDYYPSASLRTGLASLLIMTPEIVFQQPVSLKEKFLNRLKFHETK